MILITLDNPKLLFYSQKVLFNISHQKKIDISTHPFSPGTDSPAKQMESSILVGELLREISRRHKIVTSTYASRLTSSVKTLNYKAISTRINLKWLFFKLQENRILQTQASYIFFLKIATQRQKYCTSDWGNAASSKGEVICQQWIRTANEKNQK